MQHIVKIIKGSIVGIGSIMPGVSGSMIATILNIYHELIMALNTFTKHPIKAITKVWQYIVGVVIGLILGFVFVKTLFSIAPIPITLLFIGFIIGGIPGLRKEIASVKIKKSHIITLIISMLVMFSFIFIQERSTSIDSWYYFIVLIVIGILTAIALIIPGLSGATMLMALGYYQILLDVGDDLFQALFTLDFQSVLSQLPMLGLIILGGFIGLLFIGKVMYFFLKNYRAYFFFAVLGIVFISPINILLTINQHTEQNVFHASWYIWFIGGLTFAIGLCLTFFLSKNHQIKEV
ncbi:MAG: DUF368 domain-containing protein [Acholeplasmataceae bacterium]|nr:DUF368 domain-containing protein [Acholeplasmataceae bacterium]